MHCSCKSPMHLTPAGLTSATELSPVTGKDPVGDFLNEDVHASVSTTTSHTIYPGVKGRRMNSGVGRGRVGENNDHLKLAGRCLSSDVIRHRVWGRLCFSGQHLVTHGLYWIGQDLSGDFLIFICPNLPELFLHSNGFSTSSCWDPLIYFML